MTIDEAIAHAREVAKDNRSICTVTDKGCDKFSKCIKCAEEHEQLAEWLEELKFRRALQLQCEKEFFAGYENGKTDGYNKAIDDLVLQCKKVHARGLITNWGKPFGIEFDKLDEIAQQLKEGGTNGNSTTNR